MEPEGSALLIGSVVGDSDRERLAWGEMVGELALEADSEWARRIVSDTFLNVVFCINGRIWQADFEGVQVGPYTKTDSRLTVRVAIPFDCEAMHMKNQLLKLLDEVVEKAQAYLSRKGYNKGLSAQKKILHRLNETK